MTVNMAWFVGLICWDSLTQPSQGFTKTDLKEENLQFETVPWLPGDSILLMLDLRGNKAAETKITTHFNQGMQKSVSECATRQTLKYSKMC